MSSARRLAGATFLGQAVLVGVPLVTLLLAFFAYRAESSGRSAAERTLRDYAGVAGTEFVRRTAFDVGFNGYQVVIAAMRSSVASAKNSFPADLEKQARDLVAHAFILSDGRLTQVAGPQAGVDLQAWIIEEAATLPREPDALGFRHRVRGGAGETIVLGSIANDGRTIAAFDVNLAALTPFLRRSLDRAPLLPEAVGDGLVTNGSLDVAFFDHANRERLHAGTSRPSEWMADVPFAGFYYDVLAGSRVVVSIDPGAAFRLIPGGLPPSGSPVLAGLSVAGLLLVTASWWQARRERAFARMRDDFVVSVSHELRTPLAQIRLFTETILLGRSRSKEEERRFLEAAHRESIRLSRLVDNILDLSRAERGSLAVSLSPRKLAPLIASILRSFAPLAATRRVSLREHLDDEAAAAIDEPRFQQLLLNLLDNAVKYGPEESEVTVRLSRDASGVEVAVEDRGPGVPEREREKIFHPFERLDRDRQSASTGAGIGLGVVRELVALHGGTCRVEDREGGGASFVVRLPRFGGAAS